jgi:copper transport protein
VRPYTRQLTQTSKPGRSNTKPKPATNAAAPSTRRSALLLVLVTLAVVLALSACTGTALALSSATTRGADAATGFAADTIFHHDQALETIRVEPLGSAAAVAQDHGHGSHSSGGRFVDRDLAAGLVHGVAQGAVVFLTGLAAFVALVWLPAKRAAGGERDATEPFVRPLWALLGLLVVAGAVELALYAVEASGQPFSPELFRQALFETRVGNVWAARVGLGVLVVAVATWAARPGRSALWWAAAGLGGVLLVTLTQVSHAAAEARPLPFLADWLHAGAASLWTGGLLGLTLALLGPMRAGPAQERKELRRRAVRRFSRVATVAVIVLISTGTYAILLHVPNISALFTTPYGNALLAKLVLLVFLLAVGAANLLLQGRGPFERLVGLELALALGIFAATGLLTSLPPADTFSP